MAQTILIKFYGFIVHSKPNNMTLSAFPERIRKTGKSFPKESLKLEKF